MWRYVRDPQTVVATPELCQKYINMTPCPQDRGVRSSILNFLRERVQSGQFDNPTWASIRVNGVEYRTNGKHSAIVLGELGENCSNYKVVIKEFEGEDMADVAANYFLFDPPTSARTTTDLNRAIAACDDRLKEISPYVYNLASPGLAMMEEGAKYRHKLAPAHRASMLTKYPDFVVWLEKILIKQEETNRRATALGRVAVVSVIAKTWMQWPLEAEIFWTNVRDGNNPNPKSPERTLETFLMKAVGKWNKYPDKEIVHWCVMGWNCWAMGRTDIHPESLYLKKATPELLSPRKAA